MLLHGQECLCHTILAQRVILHLFCASSSLGASRVKPKYAGGDGFRAILSGMKKVFQGVVWVLLAIIPGFAAERYSKPSPVGLTKEGRHWAAQTLRKLTLEEKVGQMFSVRYFTDFQNFEGEAYRQFRDE